MSKDYDHHGPQMFDRIFKAPDPHGVGAIAGRTYDEQIPEPLIEDYLGRNAAIGATEDCDQWVLISCKLVPLRNYVVGNRLSFDKSLVAV